MPSKYIGRTVDMIYQDRAGRFTKRRVRVLSIRDGRVNVYCYERKAPRILYIDRILAAIPAMSSA